MARWSTGICLAILLGGGPSLAAERVLPVERGSGLTLLGVTATPGSFAGRHSLDVRIPQDAPSGNSPSLVVIDGTRFQNGTIELEVAGAPGAWARPDARGFIGVAFRVAPEGRQYEAIYLRPTNGRADDQIRRNHATQYIAYPDFDFARLRKESPERYESYVDLQPDTWTKMRIEVSGTTAKLFVHDAPQPVLVVTDLKLGADAAGDVALWVGGGTNGHFRNLRVTAK